MGEPFIESDASSKARRSYKKKIDWDVSNTYSMSFYSMYIDFPSWSIVRLPGGRDMHLSLFWGDALASVVMYEHQGSKDKHLTSLTKYILAVQVCGSLRTHGSMPLRFFSIFFLVVITRCGIV
jgi:hypothetical protein